MITSIMFRESSKILPQQLLYPLVSLRSMGGGPRTFPGGLNKWQWKRLHEKKAREKEKRLLDQEKQLYQARLRSQIRAKVAGQPSNGSSSSASSHSSMSPEDHIKALADRFMKPGAEDLWNENDGPIRNPPPEVAHSGENESTKTPISSRTSIIGARHFSHNVKVTSFNNSMSFGGNLQQRRCYAVGRRPAFKSRFSRRINSSSSDDGDDYVRVSDSTGGAKWPRFTVDEDEDCDMDDQREGRGGKSVRKFMSSAALGKHDVKIIGRSVLKKLEEEEDDDEEEDLSEQIEAIRQEVNRRKMEESVAEKIEEAPIFCEKR